MAKTAVAVSSARDLGSLVLASQIRWKTFDEMKSHRELFISQMQRIRGYRYEVEELEDGNAVIAICELNTQNPDGSVNVRRSMYVDRPYYREPLIITSNRVIPNLPQETNYGC